MSELMIGNSVFLTPVEGAVADEMRARVLGVRGREVTLKVEKGNASALRKGETVKLKYWDDEAIYYGSSELLTAPRDNEFAVSQPGEAVSLQRRKRFRLRAELPFTFEVLSAAHARLVSEQTHGAKTQDISAGGLAFDSDLPLQEEDQLLVNLPLESVEIHALGRVVRTRRSGASQTRVSIELRQLSPDEQNHVLRYLDEHRGEEIRD